MFGGRKATAQGNGLAFRRGEGQLPRRPDVSTLHLVTGQVMVCRCPVETYMCHMLLGLQSWTSKIPEDGVCLHSGAKAPTAVEVMASICAREVWIGY